MANVQSPFKIQLDNLAFQAKRLRQADTKAYDNSPSVILEVKLFATEKEAEQFKQYFYNWRKKTQTKSADRFFEAQHLKLCQTGPREMTIKTTSPKMVRDSLFLHILDQAVAQLQSGAHHGKK